MGTDLINQKWITSEGRYLFAVNESVKIPEKSGFRLATPEEIEIFNEKANRSRKEMEELFEHFKSLS